MRADAITLVVPFYRNAGMLREQQKIWRSHPEDVRKRLHIIVVDDCSPPTFEALPNFERDLPIASYRLFRTLVDVRWNWLFCRNLGVAKSKTGWVLLTDIDHVVALSTWQVLLSEILNPKAVYRFSRVDAPNFTPYKPHPNSWFMTRSMFHEIGGYDERFSGFYGSDAEFRDRVQATADEVVLRSDPLIRYPREVIADASTTTYGRKEPQDGANVRRIREEREAEGKWKTKRLTFPWEQLV